VNACIGPACDDLPHRSDGKYAVVAQSGAGAGSGG
jgi:hypothetical protein